MCGICGWICWSSENTANILAGRVQVVNEMNETQRRRGPDDQTDWKSTNGTCIFGHTRLRVQDPMGGGQPMSRTGKDGVVYTINYTGEIYNAKELRKELTAKGYTFESYSSDTEVLLISFMEWHENCLDHLNGIFAFVVWNEADESLFIARDRLGVKPFFYSTLDGKGFVFGSEMKAVLKHPQVTANVPFQRLETLFAFASFRLSGFVPFQDIQELLPGYAGKVTKDGVSNWRYWNVEGIPLKDSFEEAALEVYDLLTDAAKRQMDCDVTMGSLLSGGIDSSAITSILHQNRKSALNELPADLQTFSLGFADYAVDTVADPLRTDDTHFTALMVNKYKTNHRVIEVSSVDMAASVEECTMAKDYPIFGDMDTSMLLMFRAIKAHATMVLSGEGADEIFGGYMHIYQDAVYPGLPAHTAPYQGLLKDEFQDKFRLSNRVAQAYYETVKECPTFENDSERESDYRRRIYLHIKQILPFMLERKDRMSMRSGVEVRVPFTDHRLVQYAFQVPINFKHRNGDTKVVLRKALEEDILFPEEIRTRKKSPYPAAVDPKLKELASQMLGKLVANPEEPLFRFFDRQKVEAEMRNGFKNVPQVFYDTTIGVCFNLYSLNFWFKTNNVNVV